MASGSTIESLRAAWRTAESTKAAAHAALRDVETRVQRISAALLPTIDRPTVELFDRLQAEADLPAVRAEVVRRRLAALDADRQEVTARAAVRAAEDAEADAELRTIFPQLIQLLLKARPLVDRIAALKMRHPRLDVYAWPELQSPDAHGAFRPTLDVVAASAKSYGWLSDT